MEQDNVAQNINYYVHWACCYCKMVDIATKISREIYEQYYSLTKWNIFQIFFSIAGVVWNWMKPKHGLKMVT